MAKGKDKGIGLEAAKRSRPTGANYLLTIAINEYQHHPKLSNCVRDAEQLISILQEKYGFQPDHTVTLFDPEATAANLARLTDLTTELRRQLKPLGRQAEVARKAADLAPYVEAALALAEGQAPAVLAARELREETGLPVMVCENPQLAVVLGTGRVLDELGLLREIALQ